MIYSRNGTQIAAVVALGLAAALAACSESSDGPADPGPPDPGPAPVAAVAVTPQTAELEVGFGLQFEAVPLDSAGNVLAGRPVDWMSSNPAAAAVDVSGAAMGLAPGATSITAASEGVYGSASLTVLPAPITLVGAGDIADCATPWDEATADLLDAIPGIVFTLGDNAYEDGTAEEYANCYDPSWGRHRNRTYPAIGNHEYHTANGTPHFEYFGAAAGDPDKGYYSYEAGAWKVIVLNSNAGRVSVEAGSQQEQWLRAELAASDHACTLAYWHHPRFSSGLYGDDIRFDAFWQALYEYRADLVLVGHEHHYERVAPLNPAGELDAVNGIRQIIAGTGGRSLRPTFLPRDGSEVRRADAHGVLKLTLHHASYDWEFIPIAGESFTDSGSADCH